MQLNEHEKELVMLLGLGAVIGLGKLLAGGEAISARLVVGRMIIGAGLSASAGAVLMIFKEMPPTALVGIASAIGILGQSVLEAAVQKFVGKLPDDRDEGSR
ncbi:holin [Paraburkholderia sp. MM5477-R1]|uniref:holin n=1 Tax=Paraburkholderia sp. MM5477-R1 TaxID=2991062 RepID=UPI003D1E4115